MIKKRTWTRRSKILKAAIVLWFACIFTKLVSAYRPPSNDMMGIAPMLVTREEIENALKIYGVIPDVLTSAPPYFAKVTFGSRLCPRIGEQVEAHHMRFYPIRMEWPGRDNDYFTVVIVDPDAPSRAAPYEREFIHWLVVNIKGPVMMSRETIVDYLGPEPLIGTGFHRYVFLVYLQPGQMYFDEIHVKAIRGDSKRGGFSSRFFAKNYNLQPFAVNFVRSEWVARSSYFNNSAQWLNRRHHKR